MKTTIKIHDTRWFEEHCRVTAATNEFAALVPKPWKCGQTIDWLQGAIGMSSLEGQVLQVDADSGLDSGRMNNARYMVKNFGFLTGLSNG